MRFHNHLNDTEKLPLCNFYSVLYMQMTDQATARKKKAHCDYDRLTGEQKKGLNANNNSPN